MAERPTVVVIGAGVAGLCTATQLVEKGWRVTVLEARGRAGGRTFSFTDTATGLRLDNGQHVIMGCYQHTLRWLASLNQLSNLRSYRNYTMPFLRPGGRTDALRIRRWSAPWHLLFGVLTFRSLSPADRLRVVRAGLALRNESEPNDTVAAWLFRLGQTPAGVARFWRPLCLAVMNADVERASARLFRGALRAMFFADRRSSAIILPAVGLSDLFVRPAVQRITAGGGLVEVHAEVKELVSDGPWVRRAVDRGGRGWEADAFVCAVPAWRMGKILPRPMAEGLAVVRTSGIVSAYVWLEERDVDRLFEGPMAGCHDSLIQWIFKHPSGCLELTISDAGGLLDVPPEELSQTLADELIRLLPAVTNKIRTIKVIKERRATVQESPGSGKRWGASTPYRNLFIAGDWTDTGLPSTIESAVQSAYEVVRWMEEAKPFPLCRARTVDLEEAAC
jgi:zeta-carotene desaturase